MGLTPPADLSNCVGKDYCLIREQKTKEYIDLKVSKVEDKLNTEIDTLRNYVDCEIEATYEHRERTHNLINAELKEQRKCMDEFKTQMLWVTLSGNAAVLAAIIGIFLIK